MSDKIKEGVSMPRFTFLNLPGFRKDFKCESCHELISPGAQYVRHYEPSHKIKLICVCCYSLVRD